MPIDFSILQGQSQPRQSITPIQGGAGSSGGIGDLLTGLSQFAGAFKHPQDVQPTTQPNYQVLNAPQAPTMPSGTTSQTLNTPASTQAVLGSPIDINGLIPNAHPELPAVMAGIAGVETGGAKNPYMSQSIPSKNGDRAYGKYQIMGSNIPSWTREALGHPMTPQQFLNDPQAQEKTAAYHLNKNLQTYSPQDVASIWFSGRPQKQAGNSKDAYGTSVPQYVTKFNQGYLHAREATKNPQYSMNDPSKPYFTRDKGSENGKLYLPDSNTPIIYPAAGSNSNMPQPDDMPLQPSEGNSSLAQNNRINWSILGNRGTV